jgi:hypothetical protein
VEEPATAQAKETTSSSSDNSRNICPQPSEKNKDDDDDTPGSTWHLIRQRLRTSGLKEGGSSGNSWRVITVRTESMGRKERLIADVTRTAQGKEEMAVRL